MKVVIQRSKKSSVSVGNNYKESINFGMVLLVSFTEGDNSKTIDWMINKILNLRIFNDENDVMNKSIIDVLGEILSISQFTLYANCEKGNRPSYKKALKSELAAVLYDEFNQKLAAQITTKTGVFGGDMLVNIENDGPVTIILEK